MSKDGLPVALQGRVRVLDTLDAELSDDTRFGLRAA